MINVFKRICLLITAIAVFSTAGCSKEKALPNDSLHITVSSGEWDQLLSSIAEYKLQYPDVNLEVTQYETYDDRYKTLSTEIMSGRGPDILLVNPMTFPDPEKAMKAGVFADLTPFHAEDQSYNSRDYYQSVLQTGFIGKEQYIFPITFTFPSIVSDKVLLSKHNINLSESMTSYDILDEMARYVDSGAEISLFPDQPIDRNFSPFDMVDVDIDMLSDPTFKAFMKDYKTFFLTGNLTYNPDGFFGESVRIFEHLGSKYLLYNGDLWNSDFKVIYNLLSAVAANGGEPFLHPMYDANGKLNAQVSSSIAINSSSENKQNAYNFIKIVRDLPGDDAAKMYKGFSTKRTDLQELYEKSDDNIANVSKYTSINMESLGEVGFVKLRGILDRVDSCAFESGINALLFEKFLPYFKDEAPLDICISEASNWMDIYISE